jgi:hypothetical protein
LTDEHCLLLTMPAGQANGTWQMVGLSGVFMALTFVVFAFTACSRRRCGPR